MKKHILLVGLFVLALGLTAAAIPQTADKAIDPVCKMTVVKDGAKWTYDFKGTTYYFCSEGCKTSFAKDPEKYLAPTPEAKVAEGRMMGGQMMGQRMQNMQMDEQKKMQMQEQMQGMMAGGSCPMMAQQRGMMGGMMGQGMGMRRGMMSGGMKGGMMGMGPMMMEGVDKKIENTKDGIVITLTSKDAKIVKMLQDHGSLMIDTMKLMEKRRALMKEAQAAAPAPKK